MTVKLEMDRPPGHRHFQRSSHEPYCDLGRLGLRNRHKFSN
jgi:hypothetical protein